MVTQQELRESFRDRALAAYKHKIIPLLNKKKLSAECRLHVFEKILSKYFREQLGRDFVDRYLNEETSNLPFDSQELSRVRSIAREVNIHKYDPFIWHLQQLRPDFTYVFGMKLPHYPIPGSDTVKVGWYAHAFPANKGENASPLRVKELRELEFVGEEHKTGKSYLVYYGVPFQFFTKNRLGGSALAASYDFTLCELRHVDRSRKEQELR